MAFATASGDMANFSPAFCNCAFSSGLFTCSLNAVSVKPGRQTWTGTLSLLPQQEVERFAAVYKEQDLLQTTAEQALNDYLEPQSFAPATKTSTLDLPPSTAQSALPYVRHTLAHLEGMYAVGAGLLNAYDRALEKE